MHREIRYSFCKISGFFNSPAIVTPDSPPLYSCNVMVANPLSVPPGSSNLVEKMAGQKALEDIRRVATEVLADLLEGVLLKRGPKDGRKNAGKRGKRGLTLEEQDRAERQRKKLRGKKE